MKNKKKNHKKVLELLPDLFLAFFLGFFMSNYYHFDSEGILVREQTFVEESEMISAIEEVSPAVVSILVTQDVQYLYEYSYIDENWNSCRVC